MQDYNICINVGVVGEPPSILWRIIIVSRVSYEKASVRQDCVARLNDCQLFRWACLHSYVNSSEVTSTDELCEILYGDTSLKYKLYM